MGYPRPAGAMLADLADAKQFEQEVAAHLGEYVIDKTDSTTELDFWVPGFYLDVKEKKQELSARWHKHCGDTPPEDIFVLDELSLRKALKHYPAAYFVLRDRITQRTFLAGVWEVAAVPRTQVMRNGKGKLLLDMTNFREVAGLHGIVPAIMGDLAALAHTTSACVNQRPVVQV